MKRYAEFTASLIHLNVEYGDGQLDLNLDRLRMTVEDLLNKLAKMFPIPKLQTDSLTNNYDLTISILKEACTEGGKAQYHFEEVLKRNIAIYVVLSAHFRAYIQALEKLQLDIATSTDLLGVEN